MPESRKSVHVKADGTVRGEGVGWIDLLGRRRGSQSNRKYAHVFEKSDLSRRNIESFLLGLGYVRSLVDGQFGIVDEGIIRIVVFLSCTLLLHDDSVLILFQNKQESYLSLLLLSTNFFRFLLHNDRIHHMQGWRRCWSLSRILGQLVNVDRVPFEPSELDLQSNRSERRWRSNRWW